MKNYTILLFIIVAIIGCTPSSNYTVTDLKWFEGNWHRSFNGVQQFENWQLNNDTLSGFSGFVQGSDSTVMQHLLIYPNAQSLIFEDQSSETEISQKYHLSHLASDSVVFTNASINWPNQIKYKLIHEDTLEMSVLGIHNGMKKNMAFYFSK